MINLNSKSLVYIFLALHLIHNVGQNVVFVGAQAPEAKLPGVVDVTVDTWDELMKSDKHILMEFYAPWCGWCKKLAPVWAELGKALSDENTEGDDEKIIIAKFDATQPNCEDIKKKTNLRGFPTIMLFKATDRDTPVGFSGQRTVNGFVSFVNQNTGLQIPLPQAAAAEKPATDSNETKPESAMVGVVDLTPENWESKMADSKHYIVEFYAPWCGWCKKLAPVWAELGKTLNDENDEGDDEKIAVAKFDVTQPNGKEIAMKAKVESFPTVILFKARERETPITFNGPRSLRGFVSFLNHQLDLKLPVPAADGQDDEDDDSEAVKPKSMMPGVLELTVANWEDQMTTQSTKHFIVEFYAPTCMFCKKLAPIWAELGKTLSDENEEGDDEQIIVAKFDATQRKSQELLDKIKLKGYPTVLLFKAGDRENPIEYIHARTLKGFVAFLNEQTGLQLKVDGVVPEPNVELKKQETEHDDDDDEDENEGVLRPQSEMLGVVELTVENWDQKLAEPKFYLIEFYAPWCGYCKQFAPVWAQLGKALEDSSTIAVAKFDGTQPDNADIRHKLNVDGFPTVVLLKRDDRANPITFNGKRSLSSLALFLTHHTKLPLPEVLQDAAASEARPELPLPGVVELTKENWAEMMAKPKHYLIEFYTPWCTWCKKLISVWTELAEKAQLQDIVIAKYDASNEGSSIPDPIVGYYQVSGFPTISLVLAQTRNVSIKFMDAKTVYVLMEFLQEFSEANSIPEGFKPTLPNYQSDPPSAPILWASKRTLEQPTEHYDSVKGSREMEDAAIAGEEYEDLAGAMELTDDNFQRVALNVYKNVFVKFYAPWCGHCQALSPVWDRLADELRKNPKYSDLIIAKMDATQFQETAEFFQVKGYPTLLYFPKLEKSGSKRYEGPRDVESLRKFIDETRDS